MNNTADLIWISVSNGMVVGFQPEEIAAYEKRYAAEVRSLGIDYWEYFTWVYQDELRSCDAHGFSALWHMPKAWTKLEELRKRN